ncbi:MAG: pentapeptide repeat-containing protein [Chitinophagaceae bacterium]|nr:pentapeptide repeat-containing protein [Chitinophagaceae bacterium]
MPWDEILKILGSLLAVGFSAYFGYRQYLSQKEISQYSDNLKLIYSPKQEEVLAAIANLDTFRQTRHLKNITQNILINRLYTELDYNVCHAIANQLVNMVDDKNPGDLNRIIERLIDINYNYFLQTYGMRGRRKDLEQIANTAEEIYASQLQHKENEMKVFGLLDDLKLTAKQKWKEYNEVKDTAGYKIKWHKQVIADTLGIVIAHATRRNIAGIKAVFDTNDFNYCTFRNIAIYQCSMKGSAFGSSVFQNVTLSNINFDDTDLSNSSFENCIISGGTIRATAFDSCLFTGVKFQNVQLDDASFIDSQFANCEFEDVTHANPLLFYKSEFTGSTLSFPYSPDDATEEQVVDYLKKSKFAEARIEDIVRGIEARRKKAEPPREEYSEGGTPPVK